MTTANTLKTVLLLGLLTALLVLGGQAIGGRTGLHFGLVMAVVMNFASYFFSEKIALSMYRAQPVTPQENANVYRVVAPLTERLCQKMGIPMPKLWVIPESSPNAFATGRNPRHSSVAFTAGLLELMSQSEIEGVLAHELAHIKHRDILTSSIAATIGAAITYTAYAAMWFGGGRHDDDEGGHPAAGLLLLILGPIAAGLIQMAVSRTREYAADESAARAVGSPWGLISALQKLDSWSRRIPLQASPATAHMFIMKPFGGGGMMRLFSTHPATEDRIARLRSVM